jgi:hypothetical protein
MFLYSLELRENDDVGFYGPLGRESIGEEGAVVAGTEFRDACVEISGNYYLFDQDRKILNHYLDECQTVHHFMFKVPTGYCLNDLQKTLCFTNGEVEDPTGTDDEPANINDETQAIRIRHNFRST